MVALCSLLVFILVLLNVRENAEYDDPFDLSDQEFSYYSEQFQEKETSFDPSNDFKPDKQKYQLFDFDPNELDQEGFCSLGFSEKQSASIISYRENYGPFDSKEDFGKLYVVSEKKFEELKPYILIENEGETILVDINLATSDDLQTIKGIGPVYAEHIVKYRNLLGGFVSSEQFGEVYGLPVETTELLAAETIISSDDIKKINVNQADKKEMRKHPYMDFEMVALILEERNKGKLTNLDFLTGKIDWQKLEKIHPYLSFE